MRQKQKPQRKKEVSDITPLQESFFKAKYGDQAIRIRSDPKTKEEQKLSTLMKTDFKTDAHVLRSMLTDVMDSKAAVFDFDVTTDADVEAHEKQLEAEQQKKDAAAAALATAQETVKQQTEANKPKAVDTSKDDDAPPPPPPAEPGALTAIAVVSQAKKVAPSFSKRSLAGIKQSSQPLDEGTKRVLELLKTKDFVRTILPVFSAKDLAAHGLAVKVFWVLFRGNYPTRELAAEQFNNHVNFYCSGPRFTTTVRQALFTLLLTDKPTVNVEKPTTTAFYMPALHHLAWAPIFHCMQESDMEIRKQALEDVNTLLHDNFKNAKSIVRSPQWQAWIYLLLCDIPRHQQTATHKTVYAFLLNTITLIHYSYFAEDPDFYAVVCDSLQSLHLFAGLNNASAKVAHTILLALINKISSQKVSLTSDTNYESKRWQNMAQLFRLLRKFIFQTAYWRSASAAEDEKETAEDRKAEDAKKQAAERDRDAGLLMNSDVPAPKAQQEERQKLIRLMEEQRRKQQEEFVLAKSRVLKSDKDMNSEGEPAITDYGVHWGDSGEAHDLALIKKLMALFKMLHLDEFNQELASPTMTAVEKNFLLRCKAEADFWKDSDTFLTILKRQYIDDRKLLTYRKLSFVIQGWMRTSSSSARESIISDMKYTLANKGATRPDDSSNKEKEKEKSSTKPSSSTAAAGSDKAKASDKEPSASGKSAASAASPTSAASASADKDKEKAKSNKSKRDNDWG